MARNDHFYVAKKLFHFIIGHPFRSDHEYIVVASKTIERLAYLVDQQCILAEDISRAEEDFAEEDFTEEEKKSDA